MKWRRVGSFGVGIALAVSGTIGFAGTAKPAGASGPDGVLFGAYPSPKPGETKRAAVERLEGELGTTLSLVRDYAFIGERFDSSFDKWAVAGGRRLLISFKSRRPTGENIPWKRVVAAQPSWKLYHEISDMADSVKALGVPVLMAFHHEPEADKNKIFGSSDDFIAAWRKVVSIFNERGVTNVSWVWTMTSWSFDVAPTDRRAADKWYPGDDYVDYLGADAYNWNKCRPSMKEPWQPLATTIAGFMKFGDQHPNKPLVLPEFGSAEGGPGAKGAWLDEARALFKTAPYADRFAAVSYFHNDDEMTPACNWWLDSSTAALKSAQGLAQDAYFRNTAAAS